MAFQYPATAVWRVRPSGRNTNGGGFDASKAVGHGASGIDYSQQDAPAADFTSVVTNGLTCNGSTTLTDGDARGLFTPQMQGNAIQITGGTGFTAGIYFVTAYTDSNNVTLDRNPTPAVATPGTPTLTASTTGGSLATGTVYVKITYTNASGETVASSEASVAVTGPTASVVVTSPATSTGATGYNVYASSATGTEVLQNGATPITIGTNYTISSLTTGTASPPATGTAYQSGSGGTGAVGGAWADWWTNIKAYDAGNAFAATTTYVLGGGIPSGPPYSTFDYVANLGNSGPNYTQLGFFKMDPATPNYGNGAKVTAQMNGSSTFYSCTMLMQDFYFVCNGYTWGGGNLTFRDCIFDVTTNTSNPMLMNVSQLYLTGCEFFSSSTATANTATYVFNGSYCLVSDCHIHDIHTSGPKVAVGDTVSRTLIANVAGNGLTLVSGAYGVSKTGIVGNNTIDGCGGTAMVFSFLQNSVTVVNNILSNCTTGIDASGAGTLAANESTYALFDYNTFYNNATDLVALPYGEHDRSTNSAAPTVITADPYTNRASGDYSLTSSYINTGYPQSMPNY